MLKRTGAPPVGTWRCSLSALNEGGAKPTLGQTVELLPCSPCPSKKAKMRITSPGSRTNFGQGLYDETLGKFVLEDGVFLSFGINATPYTSRFSPKRMLLIY